MYWCWIRIRAKACDGPGAGVPDSSRAPPFTTFTVVLMFVAEQLDVESHSCAVAYKMVPFCGWNGRRECASSASIVDTTVATACLEEQDASAGSSVTENIIRSKIVQRRCFLQSMLS